MGNFYILFLKLPLRNTTVYDYHDNLDLIISRSYKVRSLETA